MRRSTSASLAARFDDQRGAAGSRTQALGFAAHLRIVQNVFGYGVQGVGATRVRGEASPANGTGVQGISGSGYGVTGQSSSGFAGVYGVGTTAAGTNGVYGQSNSGAASGVFGRNESNGAGVAGYSLQGGPGVRAIGNLVADGNSYAQDHIDTSDARFKTDIAPLDYGLAEILRLKPVRFAWKSDPDRDSHLGLVAQDVESVVPEAVVEGLALDGEEPKLHLSYNHVVAVLIKAMQEQQAQIEALGGGETPPTQVASGVQRTLIDDKAVAAISVGLALVAGAILHRGRRAQTAR